MQTTTFVKIRDRYVNLSRVVSAEWRTWPDYGAKYGTPKPADERTYFALDIGNGTGPDDNFLSFKKGEGGEEAEEAIRFFTNTGWGH